jgi:NSS family neurotransmitter:Na+ symporter
LSDASQQRFSSRWGLIVSVLGIAVGTGNIWRFPRIAATNGSEEGAGAFLVTWVVFLAVWSVPLIIAEYALGRAGRRGVIGTFIAIGGENKAWMGGFVALTATAIMFYYSVVTGWCFHYFFAAVVQSPPDSTAAAKDAWESFQSGRSPLLYHAAAMALGALAVRRGVGSIERINRILVPVLVAVILIAATRAITLDGSGAGITYLFTPTWSQLGDPKVWLEALTQNAWDTGAGWGLILTYAAYMSERGSVVKSALITGITNNSISLLCAITVFGTVFAVLGTQMPRDEVLAVMRDSGPASTGLTFIWMPQLFARMPLGQPLGVAFFLGLSFAAFSSLISMIELAARTLVDMGIERSRAIAIVFAIGFALGVPSALSLDLLGNQDFVWGIGLMVSGLLVAVVTAAGGTRRFRDEFANNPDDWDPGRPWAFAIRVLVPVLAIALLAWWFWLSATEYAPDSWWDPFEPYSVMTCVVQWGLAIAILYALRHRLVRAHRFKG